MGWMQLACKEAARWMSQRRDEPSSAWQDLRLKLHLKLCGDCREVERQLAQIDALSGELLNGGADGGAPPQSL